jgi:hypothetical protein
MSVNVLEKPTQQQESAEIIRIWDMDMDAQTQAAIDKILDYIARHNISPNIQVQGNLVTAVSTIIEQFSAQLPAHLKAEQDIFFNHMIHWITDYAKETNLRYLDVTFSFKQQGAIS